MKPLLVLFAIAGLANAGSAPTSNIATVIYTRHDGSTFTDHGVILEDHQYQSEREGYTYRFIVFPDHVNEYHLDEGRVDVYWSP